MVTAGICIQEGAQCQDEHGEKELDMVRRVQAGDQAAFRKLVELHQSKVHAIAYGILHNREDSEDVAQQVFAKVYFAIAGFDYRSSLFAWIYRIAVNECYSHLRRVRAKLGHETDLSSHETSRAESRLASQPAVDIRLARRDYLNKLLARISEDDRLLLVWKEVEGHSIEELASMTGLNPSAVKVRLFRARQKLVRAAQQLSRGAGLAAA